MNDKQSKPISGPQSAGSKRPIRILLLDDEPSVVFALKLLLQALEYTVDDFKDADEALQFLRGAPGVDLIICDLKMPTISGLEVLRRVKEIAPQIPFVLMSAHASDEEVAAAKQLGAFDVLAKPFTPDAVHEVIARLGVSPL